MEWRYYGITLSGLKKSGTHTLERHLEQIRRTIQQNRWTQQLPAIRSGVFERTTAFVFLAHVEDPEDLPDDVPAPVREVFQDLPFVGKHIRPSRKGGHTLEEIRSITRGALTTDSIGSLDSLFRDLALADVRIPVLDLSASEEEFLDAANPGLAARHGHLLAYLSACGEGTWERFVRAAVGLGLARHDQYLRLRGLIRRLVLLGHVEPSADQQRWSVCPPVLVSASASREPTSSAAAGRTKSSWIWRGNSALPSASASRSMMAHRAWCSAPRPTASPEWLMLALW